MLPSPDVGDRRRFLAACGGLAAGASGAAFAPEASDSVTRRLAALRPNESVLLGLARVEGDFNETARRFDLHRTGPRARNYCLKMVWSPRRKTALYLGANHGAPHRLNDVWEFDLAALRWTLLYGPDLPRDYKGLGSDASDVVFRDGVLVTRRGGPAIIGHTWSGVTYDPQLERIVFLNAWPADVEAAIRRVGGDPEMRYTGPPLWTFDPAARAWQPILSPEPWPRVAFGGLLEHVPPLKGSVWHMNNWQLRQTWVYEAGTNQWRDLAANRDTLDFARQAPGAEMVGYYDATRGLLVVRHRLATHHFDVARKRWTVAETTTQEGVAVPSGHSARTSFVHDRGTGRGVLFDVASRSIWVYDADDARWSELKPSGPPIPAGERPLCYADPDRNAILLIIDTRVWAYRVPGR